MKNTKNVLLQLLTALFSLSFLIVTGILLYFVLQPEKLPIGSHMPKIEYLSPEGPQLLKHNNVRSTVVVYFNSNCKSCRSQLHSFNNNIDRLNDISIILLTFEEDFLSKHLEIEWPALTHATNITWGVVNFEIFFEHFAPRMSPMMYVFDHKDVLIAKIRGESKLEKLLKEIKIADGPERRLGGNK